MWKEKMNTILKKKLWEDFYYLRIGKNFLCKTEKSHPVKGKLINSITLKEQSIFSNHKKKSEKMNQKPGDDLKN